MNKILLSGGRTVRFWRDEAGEIDFFTEDLLAQATLELGPENRDRELKPLQALGKRFPEKRAMVMEYPRLKEKTF